MYPLEFRKKLVKEAQTTFVPEVARKYGISKNNIHRWAKEFNITIMKGKQGRKRHPKLVNATVPKNHTTDTRHRHYLLYIFNYTCYDCPLHDPTGKDLQRHQDFDVFPPQELILCKKCHAKRHRQYD